MDVQEVYFSIFDVIAEMLFIQNYVFQPKITLKYITVINLHLYLYYYESYTLL